MPASAYWLREVRRITRELDIVLIFDEIQCGIGRSGRHFAFEHADVEPDILIMSKAVGGGLPLSCLIFGKALDVWRPGEHAGTFRGNQLAMVAGTRTLQIIQRDRLAEHATRVGERMLTALTDLQQTHACIAEVRGRGLMLGVEIAAPGRVDVLGQPLADPKRANEIQRAAMENGLIIEKGGRHGAVLRFLPPLNISDAQADFAVEAFSTAVASTGKAARA